MFCKKWFRRSIRDRANKYISLLLACKIRLHDVPKSVRMDPQVTARIHTAAFRVDRAFPIERFEEDLRLVRFEKYCAKTTNDVVLLNVLEGVEKRAKMSYEILKKGD